MRRTRRDGDKVVHRVSRLHAHHLTPAALRIAKTGSDATVVWTPWLDKANQMGDMGKGRSAQGGWREMVCVESVNAMDNLVTIAPGATHTLAVTYSAELM